MKNYITGFLIGICVLLLIGATRTEQRHDKQPVAKYSTTQLSWAAGDANTASTTLSNINGLIERIDIIINDANTLPIEVFNLTIADEGGTTLASFTKIPMDPNSRTMKLATSDATDFNAIPSNGNVVFTIDPNTDPCGVTWTMDIDIYVR